MIVRRLYIKSFRGIEEKLLEFGDNVNIVYGAGRSGKTSIVDALLFLQRYSLSPSQYLDPLLNIWFGEAVVHGKAGKFQIMINTLDKELQGFFGIEVDTQHNRVVEQYIVDDTLFAVKDGVLEAEDPRLLKLKLFEHETGGKSFWDKMDRGIIPITKLPWKTIADLVSIETAFYGIETAFEKVPDILSDAMIPRLRGVDDEGKKELTARVRKFFKYAFKLHYMLRRSVIVRYIDYKNAVGPSKIRGHAVDPHFSNLPWILYNIFEKDLTHKLSDCLRSIGLHDLVIGVEKTIDQRYYLTINVKGKDIVRDGIPVSIVKLLSLCVASCYASNLIVFDDYDEYLNVEDIAKVFSTIIPMNKQYILTSRRPVIVRDERIKIINL